MDTNMTELKEKIDLFDRNLLNLKLTYGIIEKSKEDKVNTNNNLNEYILEVKDLPKFKFYIPANLGECVNTSPTVLEIKKDNVQKLRVMVSKCTSADKFKSDTENWIEKNKTDSKMEDVAYRNENINGIPIEVYELKYSEHPDWPHKIYKIGFLNECRITISGWLVNGREEIINQAFEKMNID